MAMATTKRRTNDEIILSKKKKKKKSSHESIGIKTRRSTGKASLKLVAQKI